MYRPGYSSYVDAHEALVEPVTAFPKTTLDTDNDGPLLLAWENETSPTPDYPKIAVAAEADRQLTAQVPDGSQKVRPEAELLPGSSPAKLSRKERRAIRKTPEFKQAWEEIKQDGRPPRELGQPDSWINPERWFDAEKKLSRNLRQAATVAVRTTFDDRYRQELMAKEVDRRVFSMAFMTGLGAAAAIGAALTIHGRADSLEHSFEGQWPENEPSVTLLDGAVHTDQTEVTIYLPGFGDVNSTEEAQTWKQTSGLSEDHLTAAVDYSNEGANIPQIVEVLHGAIDFSKVTSVRFVVRSIGGLYVLPVIAGLGAPVENIVFIASPSKLSNGDFGKLGVPASHLPKSEGIAMVLKDIYNTAVSIRDDGFNPAENIAEGWRDTMHGANGLALQTEMKTAASIDIFDRSLLRAVRRNLKRDFSALYTATDEPSSDETVMVVPSSRDFKRVFKEMGVEMESAGVPYSGHANVEATATYMRQEEKRKQKNVQILAAK